MARRISRISRRASLRDAVTATNKSLAMYAALSGQPTPPEAIFETAKPRAQRKPSGDVLEKDVQRAVNELLSRHPKVLFAVRQNSGSLEYETSQGKSAPLWFYKLLRVPEDMTITDTWGFLTNGKPFAIECKKEKWKWAGTEREKRQLAFIRMIRSVGGVGGFATSADEALLLLK